MQRSDKWPDDYDPEAPRSKPGSRRNSASLSRRSSIKKEKEGKKKSPLNSTASSSNSTPKKVVKPHNLDFVVTGRQCLKRCETSQCEAASSAGAMESPSDLPKCSGCCSRTDRANSLPGTNRRPSVETVKTKRAVEAKRLESQSSKSRETSLEDDMSLDLSQVSDFEDTNSKYGIKPKFVTSTPKTSHLPKSFQKPRSSSLQNQTIQLQKAAASRKNQIAMECRQSRESTYSRSRDSICKTSTSSQKRYGGVGISTDLDYSSVSPEYSGLSSADLSPRVSQQNKETDLSVSSRSQDMQVSSSFHSCCVSAWQDSEPEDAKTRVQGTEDGEWSSFWANYNHSMWTGPGASLSGLDFTNELDSTQPKPTDNLHNTIQTDGLHLTPKEVQNVIKCAQLLGNVLTKAIERSKDNINPKDHQDVEVEDLEVDKKKTLTLDLKETNIPLEVQEEKRCETVTTQTDISLPNTKTAPRIFEKILRQLSRTSIDEPGVQKNVVGKEEKNGEVQKETT